MMRIYKRMRRFLPLILLAIAASCSYNDLPTDSRDIQLALTDEEDNPIVGVTQSFTFGENRGYKAIGQNINYVKITKPTGWLCELVPSSHYFSITAPQFSNLDAEDSGEIVIDITHQDGRTLQVKVPVATLEDDVTMLFDAEDIAGSQVFAYGRKREYGFTSANVTKADISAPKGWTVVADLQEGLLSVTAPAEGTDYDKTGNLVVTPRSLRGTAGQATTLALELSTELPVITFAETSYNCQMGKSLDIPVTVKNVASAEIVALPAGWKAELKLSENKIRVTAPALDTDTSFAALDQLAIHLTSAVGLESDASVNLGLGLSTLEQIKALSAALKGGLVTVTTAKTGAVALLNDIDLTSITDAILIGDDAAEHAVTFPFDGQNHTLTIAINCADVAQNRLGLFGVLASTAKVRNLTVKGSVFVTHDANFIGGGLAFENQGADVDRVTAEIAFNRTATTKTGAFGCLIGHSKTAKYSNCTTKGSIQTPALYRAGGMVGELADGSTGSFSSCTNYATMTLDFAASMTSTFFGGIAGYGESSCWNFTNTDNRGNIAWSFPGAKRDGQFFAMGGILGGGYGIFKACRNYADLVGQDGYSNRRVGGIVGVSGSSAGLANKYSLQIDDCHNEGRIESSSNFIGGLVGIAEKGTGNLIQNSTNKGAVMTASGGAAEVSTIAGLMGASYDNNALLNCVNSGKVSGVARYRAAGLVGAVRGTLSVTSCRNEGAMAITTFQTTNTFPLVAGLLIVEKADAKVTIRTSKNTGAITAQVKDASCINPVYIFQRAYEASDADTTDCDQITKDESAATQITVQPRN